MRLILFLVFILGTVNPVLSQTFKGEATLPHVDVDGFYRIFISPQVSPYFNADFSNIRIYDNQNKEVPYLFQKEATTHYSKKFKAYEIIEKKQEKNCCTSLILRNPDGKAINNISLSIKNAEVTKQATLLGSDDKENWFALNQHFVLYAIDNKNKTSEIRIVDFPLSNYTYYLLQLEDSTSAPVNILNAGYYEVSSEDGNYSEVPSLHVTKSDSAMENKSYVRITFDTAQVVDKVTISMTGQPYYLRKASLYNMEERENKKGKKAFYYDRICDFEVSSKQPSAIELPGIKVSQLLMIIENENNPSLELGSVKSFQLNRYLTAWLKKENQYSIRIGEAKLQSPSYDLAFFKDNIPNQTQILAIGPVNIFQQKTIEATKTFFTNQAIIWIAIILVIAILAIMSMRLIRETSTKKTD